jgi:2',3'-cyclic-nucleotide 2'-phosphodiesterase (5'-nucleotidase family)
MKRTITTDIFAITSAWMNIGPEQIRTGDIGKTLLYSISDMSNAGAGYTVVGKGTVTIELDEPETVVTNQVAVLRQQAIRVRAESEQLLSGIEDKIRNLQALTYEPSTA